MRYLQLFIIGVVALLFAAPVAAQSGLTGTLTGTVTQEGAPLPGVSVIVTSPNLQGTRTAVTNESGGYNFGALPPGEYTVRFELQGMQTVSRRVHVGVAQTARADASLSLAAVSEAITVTASAPAVAETTEVQTNFTGETIEELPVGRTIIAVTSLAPGVMGGVNGLMISGGMSFDNLYTVNGAVVQENLRGQPHNLFIEDAIQETTIQTAGISAEFGNFTGGVVNAITKSGGNEFSGSLRDSLTNPSWTEKTPFANQPDPIDELNETYEATLGGRIIRDRLWFFLAGRYAETAIERPFARQARTYVNTVENRRLEGKLTGSIAARHNLIASYLESPVNETNNCQFGCYDMTAVDPSRELPNDFLTFFYNGVLTSNFLVEAKYAEKNFAFVGSGGEDRDLITGTVVGLTAPGFSGFVNEPYFCGICTDEGRNNEAYGVKATYYLGTRSMGNHTIVAGGEHWFETRIANNFQSPTNFVFYSRTLAPKFEPDGTVLMSVRGGRDYMINFPIELVSQGSDLTTTGVYINDKWDLTNRWSFNLGLRYDRNNSTDSRGAVVADDAKISPRLGATFDVFGTGRLRLNATYGQYVGRLAETVAGQGSSAGNPAVIATFYGGPDIIDVTPVEAMRQVWAWFEEQGGFSGVKPFFQSVPGFNRRLADTLVSPNVEEYSFGASTQIGRGIIRADLIHRDWQDFYTVVVDRNTGVVTSPTGARADLALVKNSNDFDRTYDALQLQGAYQLGRRINVGANYTYSRLEGNVVGETSGGGPVTESGRNYYPEYLGFPQADPIGLLPQDQTHKVRAWATFDVPTFLGNFNFSVLQNYDSGDAYSLTGSVDIRQNANFYGKDQPGGVTNPGYVNPPTSVSYYFSERGEFREPAITSTDLAVNYSTNPGWLRGAALFAQAELLNALDESELVAFNRSTVTHMQDRSLKRFNPMAGDVPEEGVHWRKSDKFGQARTANDYQTPRTYRFSVGLRF